MTNTDPINGKYDRLQFLDSGSFGSVFRVFDRALQRERALKVIPFAQPQEIVDKLREAQILAICKHKHILDVRAADVAEVDGMPSVIIECELMKNGSVQKLLEREFLSLHKAAALIRQALFGLEHLHNNNILHCDIKPGNLLLDDNLDVKLSDFGLAMHVQSTHAPAVIYSLHRAPESLSGAGWSEACDVYAMGVTLYRLVCNITDFQSRAPSNVSNFIQSGRFPDRQGYPLYVPQRIKNVCNKAMHVDPTKRYASAIEFGQALDKIAWGVKWVRHSPLEWHGAEGNAHYHIRGVNTKTGWGVDYLINGRRYSRHSVVGLASEVVASEHMMGIVKASSLR